MKDKIKSYSFWTALSGAVVVLLQAIGDCFGFSIQSELVSGIIMAIAGVLVVFGVVSMPNKDGSTDKESEGQTENQAEENQENSEQTEDQAKENETEEETETKTEE